MLGKYCENWAFGLLETRNKKHETWEKILENGTILQTRLSHKRKRNIPKGTFNEILKQIGIEENIFREILRGI